MLFKTAPIFMIIFALLQVNTAYAHGPDMQPQPIRVAQVLERDVRQWKEFSGRLVAPEHVEIRPRISGTIDAIHFKSGSIVKKGDLLFSIDPRPYAAEVARAQGALASIEAQVSLAQTQLTRAEQLIKQKVISQNEFDTRKNAVDVNIAQRKSAIAALEKANIDLEYTKIKSPITGRISRAEITLGNLVDVNAAPILASVVSIHPIYADFEVDEHTFLQYVQKNAGQDVRNTQKIPVKMGLAIETDTPFTGYIESFDNRLNGASGTIRVRALFNNNKGLLLPGLFARIELGDPKKSSVLLITDRAVGTDQNKKFILIVDKEGTVAYRVVTLGGIVDGLRVITAGIEPGEKIIVSGLQHVRPGQKIAPELVAMDNIDGHIEGKSA